METIFAGLKNFLLVNKFLSLSLNEFLQSEIMQKSRSAQYITRIIAVANQVQFVCLFVCCAPPNSVVQINNFFRLILFSAEIRKRRGKKLISKTIKYKLGSSSKMPFALFPERHLFIHLFIYLFIWKQLILSKMWNDAYGRGRRGREVMFFASLWRRRTKIDMLFTLKWAIICLLHNCLKAFVEILFRRWFF